MSVPDTQICFECPSTLTINGKEVKILGSQVYARKDVVEEEVGGIAIPDQAGLTKPVEGSDKGDLQAKWSPRDNINTATVLAVGPKANATRTFTDIIRVGCRIMVADGGKDGVFRSPYYEHDFFLDISVIEGVIHDDA